MQRSFRSVKTFFELLVLYIKASPKVIDVQVEICVTK